MNNVYIAPVVLCLLASNLLAQRSEARGGERGASAGAPMSASEPNLGVRKNLDGSVCYPAPTYQYCNYDYTNAYALDLFRLWSFNTVWSSMHESDPPPANSTSPAPEPPPPPPPPITPVLHEYTWPEQPNTPATPATFSIVTTSGTVYLATMVWVEGEDLHFNSVDGGARQIPLSAVSRSLTQTANARKNLNLPLPPTRAVGASIAASN